MGENMSDKRLRRSPCECVLGGVCGGIAEYFDTDPTLVRLVYIILSICTAFSGVLAYVLLWIVIPERTCKCGCHCST